MLPAEAGRVFMGLILCISGVRGQANSICALKGSSVELPCSAERPTSDMKWYTVNKTGSTFVLNELSADGNRAAFNMSEESDFTLTIKDVRESDAKSYCCRENTDQPEPCWHNRTELHLADLQVKVIPTTEGQTVTLMCSTSCPLTEKPAAYIWYKNREFLYQDWSPWYQQLVSSDEAVTYSCAVKGYEDLRAPEVSVDSVTSSCFSVTYAKGRMCSYIQRSEDEPCSITYPAEVHVQAASVRKKLTTLACSTSCPVADPQTAYTWYINRKLYSHCDSQHITLLSSTRDIYSCAVKGHDYLYSGEDCCCYEEQTVAMDTVLIVDSGGEIKSSLASSPVRVLHHPVAIYLTIMACYPYIMPYTKHINQTFTIGNNGKGVEQDLCQGVNYVTRRICALEGSSVNITEGSSVMVSNIVCFSPGERHKIWGKVKRRNEEVAEILTEVAGRLEYHDVMSMNQHVLRINNLTKNDSAEYILRTQDCKERPLYDSPGVLLVVTGLKVTMTPSAEVTEGQRVTLTCSTSCPLTDDTNYIWYKNGRPLTPTENQHKHLVLDPVSSQHAGNYSCAVKTPQNISSGEETLTVIALEKIVMIMNAVKLTILLLIPPAGCVFSLMMRRKKTLTSAAEQSDKVQSGQMDPLYDSIIAPENATRAAKTEPAKQQEATA